VIPVKDFTAPLVLTIAVGVTTGTADAAAAGPLRELGRRDRLRLTVAPSAPPNTAPFVSGVITAFEFPAGRVCRCLNAVKVLIVVVPLLAGATLEAPAPLTESDARSAAPSNGLQIFPTHRE
jgi:hypothetical protein